MVAGMPGSYFKIITFNNLKIIKSKEYIAGGTQFLTDTVEKGLRRIGITVSRPVLAVICIIFGIILIIFPALVGIIVGIFLLIQGILLLTDYMEVRNQQPTSYRTTPPPPSERQPTSSTTENP